MIKITQPIKHDFGNEPEFVIRNQTIERSSWSFNSNQDGAKGTLDCDCRDPNVDVHVPLCHLCDDYLAIGRQSPISSSDDLSELQKPLSNQYRNRFTNCQFDRTLHHPSLPQPKDNTLENSTIIDESHWKREEGFRFIVTADTQFGILMDGFEMKEPNWKAEIEISRQTVQKMNNMKGKERPLFACVCGDLVDTESSFTTALAAWKRAHPDWQRDAIFEQQMKDWKEVWSNLDDDIALVCVCGNHDVGNRPTAQSIQKWSSSFGDDYLAFWANGTYHIALNNCLFYDPRNALDLFEEQVQWLESRLQYANSKGAKHIFVYSHFPWFLSHENETDEEMLGSSFAPEGWGPDGTKFSDFYFHIPIERRQIAMKLFKEYGVTACFSGHFHQNLEAKSSWGMDMIVTGPLSMPLLSTVLNAGYDNSLTIGIRAVDVTKEGFVHQFLPLEDQTIPPLYRFPSHTTAK